MKVTEASTLLNNVTPEVLGETGTVSEDLSNIVDVGRQFANLGSTAYDNFVKKIHDKVGYMRFVDRPYRGIAPSVMMDGWEWGSIMEKVRVKMPDALPDQAWQLQDGQSYDPNILYLPEASAKIYNDRVAYAIPKCTVDRQLKSAFSGPAQMLGFLSSIDTSVNNGIVKNTDALVMRTINNYIGEALYAAYPGGTYTGAGNTRAVNLLYRYNQSQTTPLTAAAAITDPGFLRFAAMEMRNYVIRMRVMSTTFSAEGAENHTPEDRLKVVLHNDFVSGAETYLYGGVGQFTERGITFPSADFVPYWQGSGTDWSFAETSAVKITTSEGHTVNASGILGVMFDREALGVSNLDRHVTSDWNHVAEFWSFLHKFSAGFFNDFAENFVVFFVA